MDVWYEKAVVPGGGYIRAVVAAGGKMTVVCKLPDGKTVSVRSLLTDNGSFCFYVGAVQGTNPKAAFTGECVLANLAQTDVTGELSWFKPVQSSATALHRSGLDTVLTANGSVFTLGSALPNGAVTVRLDGGDLVSAIVLNKTANNGFVVVGGGLFHGFCPILKRAFSTRNCCCPAAARR